jgi:hypothetical protein
MSSTGSSSELFWVWALVDPLLGVGWGSVVLRCTSTWTGTLTDRRQDICAQ